MRRNFGKMFADFRPSISRESGRRNLTQIPPRIKTSNSTRPILWELGAQRFVQVGCSVLGGVANHPCKCARQVPKQPMLQMLTSHRRCISRRLPIGDAFREGVLTFFWGVGPLKERPTYPHVRTQKRTLSIYHCDLAPRFSRLRYGLRVVLVMLPHLRCEGPLSSLLTFGASLLTVE